MAALKVIFKNNYDKKVNKNFYRYYMLRNSFIMYFITIFGIVALFMLVTGFFQDDEDTSTNFLMWLIAIIGIIFVPFYTFTNIHTSANRDYKARKDSIEQVELSKEKILRHELTTNEKMVINWVNIQKVIEVKDAFYFFITDTDAFTIAKSGLIQGTLEELRILLETYLKKDKKGRSPYRIKDRETLKAIKNARKGK